MIPTELRQGDTFRRNLTLTYKDTGQPADLSECSAFCEVRKKPGDALLLTASAVIDNGQIHILLSKDQTKTLDPGEYGLDVRIESATDRRTLYTEWVTVVLPFTERS